MTYQECIDYLFDSLPVYQRTGAAAYKANLDNIIALMKHLGNPEKEFRSIHVAGTNGKGSVSHNLASIFQEAGYNTGLYTSPHLKDFRERIRINGIKVSKNFVIDFTESNQALFEQIRPSFFEMTVAMAFSYFARNEVDIAIIETGLGGRLDSTNIITPLLSIITNISHDHTQFLGNTLADIAREKGGVIKEKIPVLISETQPETAPVFKQIAEEKKAPILFADQLYQIEKIETVLKEDGFWMQYKITSDYIDKPKTFITPLAGEYQLNNLRAVFATCQVISNRKMPETDIRKGIEKCVVNTELMGRWQVLHQHPLCILDTGHNFAGIKYVAEQLSQIQYKNLHFVISMVNDKDIMQILPLLPKDAKYYFCRANIPRGLDPYLLQEMAQEFDLYGKVYISVKGAFSAAKRNAGINDLVFVGCSTFTVAEVL
jgi:dihydrofolate synthase/folylpolyglutamate synthase